SAERLFFLNREPQYRHNGTRAVCVSLIYERPDAVQISPRHYSVHKIPIRDIDHLFVHAQSSSSMYTLRIFSAPFSITSVVNPAIILQALSMFFPFVLQARASSLVIPRATVVLNAPSENFPARCASLLNSPFTPVLADMIHTAKSP